MSSAVLAQRIAPSSRVATGALVVGFAGLTAVAAQFAFLIPPIEVPFTLQTFAVLLAGGVLGWKAGAASMLLYLSVGALGLPVFAERSSGVEIITGPTGGYLLGFVLAAAIVGRLAEKKNDRRFVTSLGAFILGSLVIYASGVAGLMAFAGLTFGAAVAGGVVPFVFWDIIKAAVAGVLLPGSWRLLGE